METFVKLCLKEISSIVGTLGRSTDTNYLKDEVEIGCKKYTYRKNGNSLTISDNNKDLLAISINASVENELNEMNREEEKVKHEVNVDFFLDDGSRIHLYNDIPLEAGYDSFENVQRHILMKGLSIKYYDKDNQELASTGIDLEKVCLKEVDKVFEFTDDGILSGNRIITLDGSTLVSVSGNDAPSYDDAKEFNLESEREKIANIIKANPDLHPFTKEALEDAARKLASRERKAKEIVNYYNEDIGVLRKAISVRNKMINGINSIPLKDDELSLIERDLRSKTIKQNVQKVFNRF